MIEYLQECDSIQLIEKVLKEEQSLLFEGLWDAPKAVLALIASKKMQKNVLIICGEERETALLDDLVFFSNKPVFSFPAWESLPGEKISLSPDVMGKRFEILDQFMQQPSPHVTVTSLQGVLQKVCLPHVLKEKTVHIKQGSSLSFERFPKWLMDLGYRRKSMVIDKGEFAIRGGLIDIFPISSLDPCRLDFFGDTIEEIRIYDPASQKSIAKKREIIIYPAQELSTIEQAGGFCTLFDYLGDGTIIFFDDLLAIEDRYIALKDLLKESSSLFLSFSDFFQKINTLQRVYYTYHSLKNFCQREVLPMQPVSFNLFDQPIITKQIEHPFISIGDFFWKGVTKEQRLERLFQKEMNRSITFVVASEAEKTFLQERIEHISPSLHKKHSFKKGYLSSGFVLKDDSIALCPYSELMQKYKVSRQKWRNTHHISSSEFYELEKGDMVVHLHNGIGKFCGIEQQTNHLGSKEEFLILEYANLSRLYVPLSQSHLVSRYIGIKGEVPKLHVLGTKKWQKTKAHAQRAIMGYARDILKMQAQREAQGGYAYPKDTREMRLFEEDFSFVETEDQLRAIQEIKMDMESPKAMDRLICGDVGYGKTEVAMRAAFKAVRDGGKQVALLVPTTVLAMQHCETFKERMSNFPIEVGVISRFVKLKEMKTTLERVVKGEIDILIGTHRLISKDVQFKNLGLIIIDEEHRFGVRVKEQLKKMKIGVDCLTLSATPIPRTLYFSLVGVRNMSVINTPPQDRLLIKTIIAEKDEQLIKQALLRELARGGQVYFIHNRVETIDRVAKEVGALLPKARISIGHGQMPSDVIDTIFHQFKRGEIDVLVATTIVENGVDIPNANTILINHAHTFGMADLYQLRGRVGRWNRTAYAYFLIPKQRELLELSQKRLQALVETSGFGGGMKLAMKDLEMRGAGDLLGVQQSGNVSAVGFHFYCKLLKDAIDIENAKKPSTFLDIRLDFSYDANLPLSYISDTSLRMEIYHRLGDIRSEDGIDVLKKELIDRFGPFPKQVQWLMALSRIRIFAAMHQFVVLKFDKLFLYAKQQIGKRKVEKKILLPLIEDPEKFEHIAKALLKSNFSID